MILTALSCLLLRHHFKLDYCKPWNLISTFHKGHSFQALISNSDGTNPVHASHVRLAAQDCCKSIGAHGQSHYHGGVTSSQQSGRPKFFPKDSFFLTTASRNLPERGKMAVFEVLKSFIRTLL